MGYFNHILKRCKVSCLQIPTNISSNKPSAIRPASDTLSSRETKPLLDFNQVDPIELPANSIGILHTLWKVAELPTNNTMQLKDIRAEALCEISLSPKDPWLGHKLLDITISVVVSRSIPPHASKEEIEKLYQDMKDNFPYEKCFKQLCTDHGISLEGPNYCHLLESILGHICRRGQNDFRDIVSTLECHISESRHNRDQTDLIKPPQNSFSYSTKEGEKFDSASEDIATHTESPSDTGQSSGNTANEDGSEPILIKVNEKIRQLFQEQIDADDLPKYTQVVHEFCQDRGHEPSYKCTETGVPHLRKFSCTITLEGLKAVGSECRSKQQAKHEASKAIWREIRARIQV